MTKKSLEEYREGGIGALMDEYERAGFELQSILQHVSEVDFTRIADSETKNDDCRSISTIMFHVISSGYEYANIFRDLFLVKPAPVQNKQIPPEKIGAEIDKMLEFTAETLEGKWELSNEEIDKLVTVMPWGTPYNLEQMLEHAVTHILRHRRQIEKFLLKFEGENCC